MWDRYDRARQAYDQFRQAAENHVGPPYVYEFHADFQTISPVRTPTDILERYLFEKIAIRGRGLAAAVTLLGAIDRLDMSVKYRNQLIAEIQKAALPVEALAKKYFGARTAEGTLDERFPSNITAIVEQTDDCIFFSKLLVEDLLAYGTRLRKQYAWKFRLPPKPKGADWSMSTDLIPPTAQYQGWLRGFPRRPSFFARLLGSRQ
jgi:hypothetical protein